MVWRAPRGSVGLAVLSLLGTGMAGCGGDGTRSGRGATTSFPTPPGARPTSTPTDAAGQRTDPAQFETRIDNPYLPLLPGTPLRYQGTTGRGSETVTVEVTEVSRRISLRHLALWLSWRTFP